jgi:peptide-methionine (S)-S-oxide reductase
VDFDPSVIAYAELVEMVLVANGPPEGQYANLVLAHDEEQLATAREQARRLGEAGGKPPTARIELLKRFWPAEDYHQKFYLRGNRTLLGQARAMYGDSETSLRESTLAMRLNGYASNGGTAEQLAREIDSFGLDEEGRAYLLSFVGDATGTAACPAP